MEVVDKAKMLVLKNLFVSPGPDKAFRQLGHRMMLAATAIDGDH